jgi:hypothetical protein
LVLVVRGVLFGGKVLTMKSRFAVGAVAVMALATAGVVAGDALKSGPQVGKKITTPFNPLNVTGAQAGIKFCQV